MWLLLTHARYVSQYARLIAALKLGTANSVNKTVCQAVTNWYGNFKSFRSNGVSADPPSSSSPSTPTVHCPEIPIETWSHNWSQLNANQPIRCNTAVASCSSRNSLRVLTVQTKPRSVRIFARLSKDAPTSEEEWGSPSRQQRAITSPLWLAQARQIIK